jgi:hypothetical protein
MELVDLLCNSCRKIHPIYPSGRRDENSLEKLCTGYPIDPADPLMFAMLRTLLTNLRSSGGCSKCISVVERCC